MPKVVPRWMNNYLINPLSQRIDNNAPHPAQVLLAAHLLCTLSDDTKHRVTESQGRGGARQGKTHQRFQNPKESGEANCTAQRFLVFTVKLESGEKIMNLWLPLICQTAVQEIVMEKQLDQEQSWSSLKREMKDLK